MCYGVSVYSGISLYPFLPDNVNKVPHASDWDIYCRTPVQGENLSAGKKSPHLQCMIKAVNYKYAVTGNSS